MKARLKNALPRKPIYSGAAGLIARAVDAAVAAIAPVRAHRMTCARVKRAALLAYESARITRTNPNAESSSADAEILPDLRRLRDLSRTLIRDDAHAATTVNILEESVVGEGIRPQAACTPEATGMTPEQCEEWNRAVEAEFERWAEEEADATKVGTFYDLQALVLRNYLQDGDGIGYALIGGDATIACQVIDADRVESPNGIDTLQIRAGVELGPHGERVAFHILPHHPDDHFFGAAITTVPTRVQAEDNGISIVQHLFKRTRAGQTRGVPLMTPGLLYNRHLHHYLDSELIAARAASNFALFIKRGVSTTDQDIFPVQGGENGSEQQYLEELEAGTIEYLNEGEEPVPFAPNRPGTAFDPFVMRILRACAASWNLSYESITRDFGRMNLSSFRGLIREMRRGFDLMRRRLVRSFCTPWWSNVIRMAVGSGRLRPPSKAWLTNQRAFLAVRWVPPTLGMIDPVTDVEASRASVEANLSTPYEEAAKQGLDAEQVLRERARFLRRAKEIELEFGLDAGALTRTEKAAPPAAPPADGDQEGEGQKSEAEESAKEPAR